MPMIEDAKKKLTEFYDSLWSKAEDAFARQAITVDPHLRHKEEDRRRGLSLIIRPEADLARHIFMGTEELRKLEPEQYYYAAEEYHVTVCSLVTASIEYQENAQTIGSYTQALRRGLAGVGFVPIEFRGLTGTPEAIMVQGFPEADALNQIRDHLWAELARAGLRVNQRYLPQAAHLTLARYAQPLSNFPAWAGKLKTFRTQFFGEDKIKEFHLVENDWYLSTPKLRPLATFSLG